MDDDADLHEQILHIEARIEELTDIIERCRKIILISEAAIAAGGTLILAIIIGAVGFDLSQRRRSMPNVRAERFLKSPAEPGPSCVSLAPQLKREWSLWPEFGWIPGNLCDFSKG